MGRRVSVNEMSPKMRFLFSRLFPLPFMIAGGITLYFGIQNLIRSKQSTEWPTVVGIVKISDVEYSRSSDGPGTHHANVQYDFIINGTTYSGDEVAYGDYGSSNSSHARKIVNRYPVGKEVKVYYLPDDPYECVLEPGTKLQAWFLPGFGMIFFTVGTAMLIFLPRLMKSTELNHKLEGTESTKV